MRFSISYDIFKEKMDELLNGSEYVRTYIDDLLSLEIAIWTPSK